MHLNFGRAAIRLTVGVEYVDARKAWGSLPGGVFSSSESPRGWSADDAPELVADDVGSVVGARHRALCDRGAVIERLLGSEVKSWPAFSFSHRIRLLPVLLVSRGRSAQALDFCRGIAGDDLARDQMVPSFDAFRAALEAGLARST